MSYLPVKKTKYIDHYTKFMIYNTNVYDSYGNNILHKASIHADIKTITLLVKSNININLCNNYGQTALHLILENNSRHPSKNIEPIVKLLVSSGANINAQDKHGYTALHLALDKELTNVVKLLLKTKADLNIKDNRGYTVLHNQCIKNCTRHIKLLVDANADINILDSNGNTPLHLASYTDPINILINAGADINIKNFDGYTPLHMEIINMSDSDCWSIEKIQLLIDAGANINTDRSAHTNDRFANNELIDGSLLICDGFAYDELIKLLLDTNANPNSIDANGNTALHNILKYSICTNSVSNFIDAGLDVNTINKKQQTVLHIISKQLKYFSRERMREFRYIFNRLIDANINVDAKDYKGRTALAIITKLARSLSKRKYQWLTDTLVKAGASV